MRTSVCKLFSVLVLWLSAVIPIGCDQSDADSYQEFSWNESAASAVGSSDTGSDSEELITQATTDTGSTSNESQTNARPDSVDQKVEVAETSSDDGQPDEIASSNLASPEPDSKTKADPKLRELETDPRALSGKPLRSALVPPVKPREVKLLVKDRKFKVVGPESALRICYDDFNLLKILNMEPVTLDAPKLMPDWLTQLEGKRVRVRGFMFPPYQVTGLKGFLLGRDNEACCFGPGLAQPYDLVEVEMRNGKTTHYIDKRPFDVVGIFHIDPVELDDRVYSLYRIDDATVIEK